VGTELFHVDGEKDRQTGTTKLIAAFNNFAKAPNRLLKSRDLVIHSGFFPPKFVIMKTQFSVKLMPTKMKFTHH